MDQNTALSELRSENGGEPMRARLNKQQAKMLLDGKCLTFGRLRFAIPEGDSDIRTILENFANGGEVMSKYDVFINVRDRIVEVEEKTE